MRCCTDSPPGQLLLGIRQFNNREWYECHETVEALWMAEPHGNVRLLYQGIIQLAVALHHWRNGNYAGTMALLSSGADILSQIPDICMWIDVSRLISDAHRLHRLLDMKGERFMTSIDDADLIKITTVSV